MRRTHDLDAKDQQILALLEADARRPNSDIARLTSLSAPTVAERIARLRDIGVIKGFSVQIDAARDGLPIHAVIQFRPAKLNDDEAAELVSKLPEVRDCFRVTGEVLLIIVVRVADTEKLRTLLAFLYKYGETSTSVVLNIEVEQRPIFAAAEPEHL